MNTEWVAKGVQAAEWDMALGRHGSGTITTVAQVTPTQVTCATGHRYWRHNLYAMGEGRGFLLPLTDRRVVNMRAREELNLLRRDIDRLCRDADVDADVDAVRGVLARIGDALAATQAAIGRLADAEEPSDPGGG